MKSIFRTCTLFSVIAVMVFAVLSDALLAEEIERLPLDDSGTLGTSISTDSKVKVEGKASVRISTLGPTTICLAEVSKLNVEHAKLVYQAKVRSAECVNENETPKSRN